MDGRQSWKRNLEEQAIKVLKYVYNAKENGLYQVDDSDNH